MRFYLHRFAAFAVLAAAAAPAPGAEATGTAAAPGPATEVFTSELRRAARDEGWEEAGADGKPYAGESLAASDPAAHGAAIQVGALVGPRFAVRPFGLYRVAFDARAAQGGHVGVMFLDAAGAEIAADVYDLIDAGEAWRRRELVVRAHADAVQARIRFQTNYNLAEPAAVAVRDVVVTAATAAEAADWGDRQAAACGLLQWEPPADRGRHLRKTIGRLREGGRVRIVMLGDSICNDTANSVFEAALARHYPRAQIEVVVSVRGATGCWWYRHEDRVRRYVLDYEPDLLVITGISHGFDALSIADVIGQVQAASDCEILMLSGAISPESYIQRSHLKSRPGQEAESLRQMEEFMPRLRQVCHAAGVEFLDSRAVWEQWLLRSRTPLELLLRDQIHGNSRGRQMAGRILTRYLAPADEP